jgi:hypothetical protein
VRGAARERHDVTGPGGHATALVTHVEGELALLHQVDLTGVVAVHHRRAATGVHAHLVGVQGAVGVLARGEDRQLVGSEQEPLGCGNIDR